MEPPPVYTSQALDAFHYFLNEQESRRACSSPGSNQELFKLLERMTISYVQRSASVATHQNDLGRAAQDRHLRVPKACRTRLAPQQTDHEEKQGGIHKPL